MIAVSPASAVSAVAAPAPAGAAASAAPVAPAAGVALASPVAPAAGVAPASPVAPAAGQAADAKIVEAAKGFEAIFMTMLADEMFKGTEITRGNSIYSGLMTQQFGNAMADSGGLGLAAMLTKQLGGEA